MPQFRILPSRLRLPETPTQRRHDPRPAPDSPRGYEVYRSCLRWDFGFTCAFCLLHEVQVAPGGARTSRQFSIEHLVLKKDDSDLAGRYDNVVYACSRCNGARDVWPRQTEDGRRLLDPCSDAWASHFVVDGDEIHGVTEHGRYTEEAYDLNDPVKTRLRGDLRDAVEEALWVLEHAPASIEELMTDLPKLPPERQQTRLETVAWLHRSLRRARLDLQTLQVIPADCDPACRCKSTEHHSPPDWLIAQAVSITLA
jgi:hypothetical protein